MKHTTPEEQKLILQNLKDTEARVMKKIEAKMVELAEQTDPDNLI